MHVAAIGLQIEDRVADNLARSVVRDVAAASRLRDFDAELRETLGRGQHIGTAAVALHAKRDDRGMLQQDQEIWNAAGAALLDELALKCQSLAVGNETETADLEGPPKGGHYAGGNARPGWRRSSPTGSSRMP